MTTTASDLAPLRSFERAVDPQAPYGVQLRQIRAAAPAFRDEVRASGRPDYVGTFDLVALPYPTRFGLWRAARTPAPFLTITNRLLVVRWTDTGGTRRTLLFEPSDVELGRNTPYFAALARRMPAQLERLTVDVRSSVLGELEHLGIAPDEVDYLAFDHLHTQDVRRLVGTTTPQTDLSPERPVAPWFPRARLLVQAAELAALADLHPLQRPWYQPETYRDLRPEAVQVISGDVLLGPGVALMATPGHALGNQSLVLNTDSGIWAVSENVIAAECLVPEHSRIPGVARWARQWGQELVLNANTVEETAAQYNSCVKERSVVDPSAVDGRFPQFFPSSELTRHWANPGTAPTFTHGSINHGALTFG